MCVFLCLVKKDAHATNLVVSDITFYKRLARVRRRCVNGPFHPLQRDYRYDSESPLCTFGLVSSASEKPRRTTPRELPTGAMLLISRGRPGCLAYSRFPVQTQFHRYGVHAIWPVELCGEYIDARFQYNRSTWPIFRIMFSS